MEAIRLFPALIDSHRFIIFVQEMLLLALMSYACATLKRLMQLSVLDLGFLNAVMCKVGVA